MSEHKAIIPCENYSHLRRLLKVTAYVLKFIKLLRKLPRPNVHPVDSDLTTEEVDSALVYWLKSSQSILPQMEQFRVWSQQFGLFRDDNGLWRCGGRLGNSELHQEAKHPVFLGKTHHLTTLIVRECHERVMHSGVNATLTELRSRYWVVKGYRRSYTGVCDLSQVSGQPLFLLLP